jgi:tetratricopeptide (TPR) repeat protein
LHVTRTVIRRERVTPIRTYFETARQRFEASGDRRSLCLLHSNYALMGAVAGLHSSVSVECYREANRLARGLADPSLQIAVGVPIGSVINAGLLRECLGWTNACIELIEARGPSGAALMYFDEQAWSYSGRAWARIHLGEVAEAVADSDRGLELARERNDFDRCIAHMIRSAIDSLRGDVLRGLEHARRHMEFAEKVGGATNRAQACWSLGHALFLAGHWQEAVPWLEEARGSAAGMSLGGQGLASVLLQCGEPERALGIAREDVATAASQGCALVETSLQIELAEVAARCGHGAEARAALVRASDLATRIECRILVPRIHETAAILAAALGDAEQQQAERREARRLYEELGATGHAERLARELGT